nr:MAG TPA: hypothetical protein [Caudoviricetes sp.]
MIVVHYHLGLHSTRVLLHLLYNLLLVLLVELLKYILIKLNLVNETMLN